MTNSLNETPEIQVAQAILLLEGKYVLQLRDNNPNIIAPGWWSFFGGKIDSGENPSQAIRREIFEELSLIPEEFRFLWSTDYISQFTRLPVRGWYFMADVTEIWKNYKLSEGQAAKSFLFEEVRNLEIASIICQTIERYHNTVKNSV